MILLISLLLMISCNKENQNQPKQPFFLGKWHVKNAEVSDGIYEEWKDSLSGIRYNQQGIDTLYSNKMFFDSKNDSSFLVIESKKDILTKYYITQKTDTSFTAENPNITFPSKFIYSLRKDKLHVQIFDSFNDHNFMYVYNKVDEK